MAETIKFIVFVIVLAIPAVIGGMVVIGGGDGTWHHERNVLINGFTNDTADALVYSAKRMKWVEGIESSRTAHVGGPKKGMQWKEVVKLDGQRHEYTLELLEYEPEKLVVLKLTEEGSELTLRYGIKTGGSIRRTRVMFSSEGQLEHWLAKLFEPVHAAGGRGRIDADLAGLKTYVESVPR